MTLMGISGRLNVIFLSAGFHAKSPDAPHGPTEKTGSTVREASRIAGIGAVDGD
jgi:hypothetical protein